ncbi:MAG: hypothetical protein L6300_03000 [Syntrophaceae bacterium]|nr:hypothetical protein [Syntrophaceae bacterium]
MPTVDRSKATVLVKVRFLDKDRRMLPDMSAKVSFLPRTLAPEEMKPRLAAGRSALIDLNCRTFAYLLEGNQVRETPVRVGATFPSEPLPFYGKSDVYAGNRGKRGAWPCFAV